MTAHDAARLAYAAGLSIIPPLEDGSKRPVGTWKTYQTERAGKDMLRQWWGPATGLGTICGKVSGNLEAIDFDERAPYDSFVSLAREAELGDLLDRLENGYVEDTPRGGVHWLYRCETISGNLKLACRPTTEAERRDQHDKVKTTIETRGEGGFVVLAPSGGGVHETGKPYVLRGGSFATIPTITPEERADLHALARALDEMPTSTEPGSRPEAKLTDGTRPGDAYAAAVSWSDVLTPAGWTFVFERDGESYWRRPGKRHGISATTNCGGSDLLIVFSSSTPFETHRGYGKFSAYAKLYHGDNHGEAARALARLGYSPKPATPREDATYHDDDSPATPPNLPALVHASDVMAAVMMSLDAGPPKVVATPFGALNRVLDGGFRAGEYVFLGARPSVGKTALALEIARHAAKSTPVIVISREMVNEALGRRLIAQDGRVSASDLRCHRLDQSGYRKVGEAMSRIAELHLWMTDEALSLTDIEALVGNPPAGVPSWGLIVVDYLQLVRAPKGIPDRRMQIEAVSQGLKALAVARKCPVLCLAALRRAPAGPIPRPTMSDLKESSGLEHDADIIMLMHREDPPEGPRNTVIEVNVAKNRDGETGMRELVFTADYVSFAERDYGTVV